MQDSIQVIIDALHALERETLSKRARARCDRLHRVMEEALHKHADALKVDVTAFSGGGPKLT